MVLKGVPQLVGEDDLVHRREGPFLADRVQPPPVRPLVVEARHVLLQDLRAQGAQVRPRGQQVERLEEALVGTGDGHGVLVVEELAEVRGELLPPEEGHGDVASERHAAGLGHLLLQTGAGHLAGPQQTAEEGVDEVRRFGDRSLLARRRRGLRRGGAGEQEDAEGESPRATHAVTRVRRPATKPRTV